VAPVAAGASASASASGTGTGTTNTGGQGGASNGPPSKHHRRGSRYQNPSRE
jgi:hypothetical protein